MKYESRWATFLPYSLGIFISDYFVGNTIGNSVKQSILVGLILAFHWLINREWYDTHK